MTFERDYTADFFDALAYALIAEDHFRAACETAVGRAVGDGQGIVWIGIDYGRDVTVSVIPMADIQP